MTQHNLSPQEWLNQKSPKKWIDLGLKRIGKVAELSLKNRQKHHKIPLIISIAGTNGKGTTGFILAQLFKKLNIKAGWFSSPHLHVYNERIQIDCNMATDQEILNALKIVDNFRIKADVKLSYFEYSFLSAMDYFIKNNVKVMILEVGLGGRLDATNLMDADISIISSIGLDHMYFLGDNKKDIAKEKSGIFRKNKIALIGKNANLAVLINKAKTLGMKILQVGKELSYKRSAHCPNQWDFKIAKTKDKTTQITLKLPYWIKSKYQLSNVALASTALIESNLINREQIKNSIDLSDIEFMGRMQEFKYKNINYLVDVAHNPQAIKNLTQTLNQQNSDKIIAVVAFLENKDYLKMIRLLNPFVNCYYLIHLDDPRVIKPKLLSAEIRKILGLKSAKKIHIVGDVAQTIDRINQKYNMAEKVKTKQVYALGCFALANQMIQWFNNNNPN